MSIRQQYREATVSGATPVELVIRLYEQLVDDLRQAAMALEKKDIRLRTGRIKHALLVIGYLQSSLDFETGGKVARDLEHFYNVMRQNVVVVQFQPSQRGFAQLITDLLAVREAWIEVDRAEKPPAASSSTSAAGAVPSYGGDSDSERVRMNYQG